jgi:hypothetical protein
MSIEEKADIKEIKAELGRIKGHMDIFKGYGKTLDSIENALIGNVLNGFSGVVHKVDKMESTLSKFDERIESIEQFRIKSDNERLFVKWVAGIIFVSIVGATVNNYFAYKVTKDKIENNTEKIKQNKEEIEIINGN